MNKSVFVSIAAARWRFPVRGRCRSLSHRGVRLDLTEPAEVHEDYLLELDDIEAGYGRAALVLRGLTVKVPPATVVCLVGPNGAGNSTVLKVASGMLTPRSGTIRVHIRPELHHTCQGLEPPGHALVDAAEAAGNDAPDWE